MSASMGFAALWAFALVAFAVSCMLAVLLLKLTMLNPKKGTVGFFHPSAEGGGGGERVLWVAIETLSQQLPEGKIHIYMAKPMPQEDLKQLVLKQFGISITSQLSIEPLQNTEWLSASKWPHFTLLGQTLAAALVGYYAARQFVPEVWIDTTGQVGPYILLRLAGARVVAYVHYPTISTDMLARVSRREATYNNSADIAASPIKSWIKIIYYRAFAALYGFLGGFSNVALVNSNWTRAHVESIWWGCSPAKKGSPGGALQHAERQRQHLTSQTAETNSLENLRETRSMNKAVTVVFPPCDVSVFAALPLQRNSVVCVEGDPDVVLCSVGQFRPEKNHALQLRALKLALDQFPDNQDTARSLKLVLIGGCRNQGDADRAAALVALAQELGISEHVQMMLNAPFSDVVSVLGASIAGLHSMTDEHFGISVVEYLAAGCIPIAHDSGGPKQDIVVPALRAGDTFPVRASSTDKETPQPPPEPQLPVGFLAHDEHTYASCIIAVLRMGAEQRTCMARAGRQCAARFSHENFSHAWMDSTSSVLPHVQSLMVDKKE